MCLHIWTMSRCVYTMTRHVFMYLNMSWCVQTMSKHIFVMPMVLSMALLHSLGYNDENVVKHDFFSHLMLWLLAMLSYDASCIIYSTCYFTMWINWNKVRHDSFGHVTLLAPVPASHDTDGTVKGTILFVRSRWLKQDATQCLWYHYVQCITWHWWQHQ